MGGSCSYVMAYKFDSQHAFRIAICGKQYKSSSFLHAAFRINHLPIFIVIMGLMSFDCRHVLFGMVSYVHVLVAFAAIANMLGD